MMNTSTEDKLFFGSIFTMFGLMIIFIIGGYFYGRDFETKCEAAGGVAKFGQGISLCLDPKYLVEVK